LETFEPVPPEMMEEYQDVFAKSVESVVVFKRAKRNWIAILT
jgi:hypothetical protein